MVCAWAQSKGGAIQRIWLFGSIARGDASKVSDIDLAVEIRAEVAGGADESGGFAIWAQAGRICPRQVPMSGQ